MVRLSPVAKSNNFFRTGEQPLRPKLRPALPAGERYALSPNNACRTTASRRLRVKIDRDEAAGPWARRARNQFTAR